MGRSSTTPTKLQKSSVERDRHLVNLFSRASSIKQLLARPKGKHLFADPANLPPYQTDCRGKGQNCQRRLFNKRAQELLCPHSARELSCKKWVPVPRDIPPSKTVRKASGHRNVTCTCSHTPARAASCTGFQLCFFQAPCSRLLNRKPQSPQLQTPPRPCGEAVHLKPAAASKTLEKRREVLTTSQSHEIL